MRGGHTARRAERHIGYDVVTVRTQYRFVGVDLVVRFVQQREMQSESQQQKCHRRDREMDDQLQPLGNVCDIDESKSGIDGEDGRGEAGKNDPDNTRRAGGLVGRTREPQCGADEPAHGSGGQWHRDPADACLDDEGADGAAAGDHARGELRRQPGEGGRGREVDAPSAPIMKPSKDSRVGAAAAAPQ